MTVAIFLQPKFISALSNVAVDLELNRALTKLQFAFYRMKIGGKDFEFWPFLSFFFPIESPSMPCNIMQSDDDKWRNDVYQNKCSFFFQILTKYLQTGIEKI